MESPAKPRRHHLTALARIVVGAALLSACSGGEIGRPSVLLFVLDTTRADAVSAYGSADATTPAFDALAREGLLFRHAFAHAPWTLPSHATLFTGLLPSQHGVGFAHTGAGEELVTLAERLRDAGYETFGVSENPWVTPAFHLDQGFDEFVFSVPPGPSAEVLVEEWLSRTRSASPRFVFVNVIDAHAPYLVRPGSRFAPDVTPAAARNIPQQPGHYLCAPTSRDQELRVLRALYRGDVAAADSRLSAVQTLIEATGEGWISVITSDHGELFGEHGLVSHQFSVANPLLHVPLAVHGLPGVTPGVIDTPVGLADLMPSILAWVGLEVPEGLAGRPLPTDPDEPHGSRALLAQYVDPASLLADSPTARGLLAIADSVRENCGGDDPVFGNRRTVIQYPYKLVEHDGHPTRLYDLRSDPGETRDVAPELPERVATLRSSLPRTANRAAPVPDDAGIPSEVQRSLEALGYADDPADATRGD